VTTLLPCCLRAPIPEIATAAKDLDSAVSAYLLGRFAEAEELIRGTNLASIREWTESLWGRNSPYIRLRLVPDAPTVLLRDQRIKVRMPTTEEKRRLFERDGFHCRFCGIPVIRREVRERIRRVYPDALPWGRTNVTQHAAFQAMWAQYDHLLPHARGGNNDLNNVVITCAPCNFARMNSTLEEIGLLDPRTREPLRSNWDGLERFR
jgi:5-methylcytosine-specific restriction endonuclease McrA